MKDLFEKLLSELKQKNVIVESDEKKYLEVFDKKMEDFQKTAIETAIKIVTEDVDDKHTEMLQTVADRMDEDHTNKLNTVVEAIDEKHGTMLEEILEKIDEDHADKLEQVLEAIDEKHASMLENVIARVDEDHTEKMQKIYDMVMESKDAELGEKVALYLKSYLEEAIPSEKLVDEAKLKRYEKMFESLKELLFVNDDYIQTEVKEALVEAKTSIDEKDQKIDSLILEKMVLKEKVEKMEAAKLLEEKVNSASPKLRSHLTTKFKDASKQDINEGFENAIKEFNDEEKDTREQLEEAAKTVGVKPAIVITDKVGGQEETVIKEEAEEQEVDARMKSYMGAYTKSIRK